nr:MULTISPECIES: hypothetical protein [Paraburkholderia]
MNASITSPAAALLAPVFAATASTSSCLFITFSSRGDAARTL